MIPGFSATPMIVGAGAGGGTAEPFTLSGSWETMSGWPLLPTGEGWVPGYYNGGPTATFTTSSASTARTGVNHLSEVNLSLPYGSRKIIRVRYPLPYEMIKGLKITVSAWCYGGGYAHKSNYYQVSLIDSFDAALETVGLISYAGYDLVTYSYSKVSVTHINNEPGDLHAFLIGIVRNEGTAEGLRIDDWEIKGELP